MINKQLLKKIEQSKLQIAKERDLLRELIDEANGIYDHCESAIEDLERAADTLSQYL